MKNKKLAPGTIITGKPVIVCRPTRIKTWKTRFIRKVKKIIQENPAEEKKINLIHNEALEDMYYSGDIKTTARLALEEIKELVNK